MRLNAAKCGYNVFFKETLSKLQIIISRLHEQLRERPKAHFSQDLKLRYRKTIDPHKHAENWTKRKMRRRRGGHLGLRILPLRKLPL